MARSRYSKDNSIGKMIVMVQACEWRGRPRIATKLVRTAETNEDDQTGQDGSVLPNKDEEPIFGKDEASQIWQEWRYSEEIVDRGDGQARKWWEWTLYCMARMKNWALTRMKKQLLARTDFTFCSFSTFKNCEEKFLWLLKGRMARKVSSKSFKGNGWGWEGH